MALDTALRRASAINPASPWRGIWPAPDGTVGQPDRQVVAYLYSGIEAGAGGGGGSTDVMPHTPGRMGKMFGMG